MFKTFIILILLSYSIINAKSLTENLFFDTNRDVKIKLQMTPLDMKKYEKSMDALNSANFVLALSIADNMESDHLRESMITYILWQKYKTINIFEVEDNFSNLLHFIQKHQYLPDLNELKAKAEQMYISTDIPYQYVKDYFKTIKPEKPKTILKLLAHEPQNAVTSFHNYNWIGNDLDVFLEFYGKYLNRNDYIDKIEKLILDKKYDTARTLLKYVDEDYVKLYTNIMNGRYNDVPKKFQDNELYLYHIFLKAHKDKNTELATNILLDLKKETKYQLQWWTYQKFYSRDFFKNKDYKRAYFLATNHNLPPKTIEYTDAEWLAGWIALEFLGNIRDAHVHFNNLFNSVTYPVGKSRAAYWLGRTSEKNGDIKSALNWYNEGAKHQLYFYGQLALYKKNEILGIPSLIESIPLPKSPSFTDTDEEEALNNEIVSLAYLIANTNKNRVQFTELFRNSIQNTKTEGVRSAIFEIVKNTKDEQLITNIARFLSYRNIYFVDNLFPILNMINLQNSNSHLIHAIIRQESGFHITATSRVGASGFMQVMPATAKEICKKMKLRYNEKALKNNPVYNILIGSFYINQLLKQWDGNQVLAIASYNAGPNAVKKWIERYGDPREMGNNISQIINWIESVEYSETRDYIQRIIENSVVYEYILARYIKELEKTNPPKTDEVVQNPLVEEINLNKNEKQQEEVDFSVLQGE